MNDIEPRLFKTLIINLAWLIWSVVILALSLLIFIPLAVICGNL